MARSMWGPGEYEKFMGVKGKKIVLTKLVSRTHFKKGREKIGANASPDKDVWQWRWATKTPDEQDTTGVGGEGYARFDGAVNGFFSQQGFPEWTPDLNWINNLPEGYTLQKISDDHYVICKYEEYAKGVPE